MERSAHRIEVVAGARPEEASLIFVSTDVNGTPGDLNKSVQESLGVEFPIDPKLLAFQGYQIAKLPRGPLLVWIVTVGGKGDTAAQLNRNLRGALPEALEQLQSLEIGARLWVPLMGTGAGGLDHEESTRETLEAFGDVLSGSEYDKLEVIVSLHPNSSSELIERVRKVVESERYESTWARTSSSDLGKAGDAQKTGFGLKFQREISDKLALDRDKFALALTRLFRIANGEFSLALLGRWGSGKTTIANRITAYLSDEDSYESDFSSVFGRSSVHEVNKSYEVVEFNAWRYRRQPELWIWLYESFVSTYLQCSFGARIIRPIRAGIEKQGFYPTIVRLLLLAIAAYPFMWLTLVLPYGVALFGLSGLVGLVLLGRRWQSSLRSLVDRYGLVASHRDKLGMQATVGEDLKSLVKSWAKFHQFSRSQKFAFAVIFLAFGILWGSTLVGGTEGLLISSLREISSLLPVTKTALSSEDITLSVSVLAWAIWCGIAISFGVAVLTDYARVDRILLVVDDLDRCPQEEIVDLIDGIKLMIDDKEVGAVVQVLVLADDTILQAAIRKRFAGRVDEENHSVGGEKAQWRAAVREHMEKVFLCHISIPVLTADDIEPLVDAFGSEFGGSGASPDEQEPTEVYGGSQSNSTTVTTIETEEHSGSIGARLNSKAGLEETLEGGIGQSSGTTKSSVASPEEQDFGAEIVLSEAEISAVKSAMQRHFAESTSEYIMTPRSVRSLLFKYQLARMIMQANGIRVDAEALALPLVKRMFGGKSQSIGTAGVEHEVAWVVELVA